MHGELGAEAHASVVVPVLLLAELGEIILADARQGQMRRSGFFGEGMARAPGRIAADPPSCRR